MFKQIFNFLSFSKKDYTDRETNREMGKEDK